MYRLTYEFADSHAFPRYFEPSDSRLSYAVTWTEALKNARRVIGKTRKANLAQEQDPSVVERRVNKSYIVTIRDIGE
jgi:hypothetical protein